MCVKFSPEDLNSDPCPSLSMNTYICRVTSRQECAVVEKPEVESPSILTN